MVRPAYPLRLPTRLPLLWRVMMLSLMLGALTANAWAWLQGEPFRGVPSHVVMGVAAPSVLLWYYGLAASAGDVELKLFDSWGVPRRLRWDEIESATLARWPQMLFAPSLRLVLTDGRVRWLPRESNGLGELHALALRLAGPGHPLTQVLETPLHRL